MFGFYLGRIKNVYCVYKKIYTNLDLTEFISYFSEFFSLLKLKDYYLFSFFQ